MSEQSAPISKLFIDVIVQAHVPPARLIVDQLSSVSKMTPKIAVPQNDTHKWGVPKLTPTSVVSHK